MSDPASTTDKYKMFRNFMVNELGIGRDDLKAWTMESVDREVQKLMGQINIPKMVEGPIRQAIRGAGYSSNLSDDVKKIVREAIAEEIAGRIVFLNPEKKDG